MDYSCSLEENYNNMEDCSRIKANNNHGRIRATISRIKTPLLEVIIVLVQNRVQVEDSLRRLFLTAR